MECMWFFYALSLSLCGVTKENQKNVSGYLASVLRIETLAPVHEAQDVTRTMRRWTPVLATWDRTNFSEA